MDSTQLKISRASRRMTVILKIAGIVTSIATILVLMAICILIFSGETVRQSFLSAFHVAANNGTTLSLSLQPLFIMFSFAMIDTAVMTIIIFFVHAIFNDIAKHCTPFSPRNTARIKKIAILVIGLSLVGSCSDALVDYYTIGALTWRVNMAGLIIGMTIYCIALIFRYGCDLQRQSDETL